MTSSITPEILYNRLLKFAIDNLDLVKMLPRNDHNRIYGNQLTRSSSSPGGNYLEAIEAESLKDFIHKMKICRKELRESIHWETLLKQANKENQAITEKLSTLLNEANELVRIFSSSIKTLNSREKK